jgi:hypothetical protein
MMSVPQMYRAPISLSVPQMCRAPISQGFSIHLLKSSVCTFGERGSLPRAAPGLRVAPLRKEPNSQRSKHVTLRELP